MKSNPLAILTFVLMLAALYAIFIYAPTEQTMGPIGEVQRIFYFHVASNWTTFLATFFVFGYSILFLMKGTRELDIQAAAAAELGTLFGACGLISGTIWAKPIWGIWWTWDARLTLTFVLGLLYLSYLLLRSMIEEPDKRALFSALFGIFAFLDVPLVYFSIRWWRTQHPQPVILGGPGSGLEPRMRVSYLLMWGALTGLLILLLSARYRLEALRASVEDLRREAEVR